MTNDYPAEFRELALFLENIRPFSDLSRSQLLDCCRKLESTYHRSRKSSEHEEEILDYDNPTLFIVRAGIFDVRSADGELIDRVAEGGFFGFISLLTGKSTDHKLHVVEDGLLLRLNQVEFKKLRSSSINFDQYFNQAFAQRLKVGLKRRKENQALATRVSSIMSASFISTSPQTPIAQAAKAMTEHNIASIGICDGAGALLGIFTDKDCRSRVVAQSKSTDQPLSSVMSSNPIVIEHDSMIHEATILMMRHRVKHLPVIKDGKPIGMITLSDIIRLHRSDPVLLIDEINKATSVPELVEISKKFPELLLHLIQQDVRADDLGRVLTSLTGSLTRQLVRLGQEKFGPEPVPFVWMAFGSQGRQDQSAKSDQDNGLLLSDHTQPEHQDYFKSLAEFVNHGLDACGYVYCPGDIMAKNDRWRLPLHQWKSTFEEWIHTPTQKALMHCNIFFDMRAIYASDGADGLFEALQGHVSEIAKESQIFLALLADNALTLKPPLGIVRDFVLETSGDKRDTFDIKLKGIMPITEIVRIHALAHGVSAVNTNARIDALMNAGNITSIDAKNLKDALEFISHQRLIHQGRLLEKGLKADNNVNPKDQSHLVNQQLKDAFKVVRESQKGLKQKFQSGLL